MKSNNNNSSKKQLYLRLGIILLALIVVSVGIGVSAKYVTQKKALSSTLHVNTSLSRTLFIDEHAIVPDGSGYTLSDDKTGENEYVLHPGVSVPKDPTIHIEGKTSLKAYLFVEVVDKISENYGDYIEFELNPYWHSIDLTGPNGGSVYVYYDTAANKPVEVSNANGQENIDVEILKNNQVQVSPDWEPGSAINEGLELNFFAYMIQCQEGDLADLFTAAFITPKSTSNP